MPRKLKKSRSPLERMKKVCNPEEIEESLAELDALIKDCETDYDKRKKEIYDVYTIRKKNLLKERDTLAAILNILNGNVQSPNEVNISGRIDVNSTQISDRDKDTRVILNVDDIPTKREPPQNPTTLKDPHIPITPASSPDIKKLAQEIFSYIWGHPGVDIPTLSRVHKTTEHQVQRVLQHFLNEGRLQKNPDRTYSATKS